MVKSKDKKTNDIYSIKTYKSPLYKHHYNKLLFMFDIIILHHLLIYIYNRKIVKFKFNNAYNIYIIFVNCACKLTVGTCIDKII